MKKVLIFSMMGLFLFGCSKKTPLEGVREDIILSNAQANEIDVTPVVIDEAQKNDDFVQTSYSSEHYYRPLRFVKNPKLVWYSELDFEAHKSAQIISPAVVANGKVFCVDAGGMVYAFNSKNGDPIWKKSSTIINKDGQIGCAIAYDDGKVIVSTSFSEAMAFDEKNGELIWRIKLPAPCKGDGITIYSGKAYMLCDNSSLQVIDLRNGKLSWSHSGMTTDTTFAGTAGPAIKDGVIYFAYPSGEVFALMENGALLWSAMLSKFSFVNASQSFSHPRACPVIKDNLVYFTNANQQTTAFDARTGAVVWRKDVGSIQTPVVSGNSIFIYNSDSELVCLNKDNGKQKWIKKLKAQQEYTSSLFGNYELVPSEWFGPVLSDDGLLMVSSNGFLQNLSPIDGSVKYTIKLDDFDEGVNVRPIIADGRMFLPINHGMLDAYK